MVSTPQTAGLLHLFLLIFLSLGGCNTLKSRQAPYYYSYSDDTSEGDWAHDPSEGGWDPESLENWRDYVPEYGPGWIDNGGWSKADEEREHYVYSYVGIHPDALKYLPGNWWIDHETGMTRPTEIPRCISSWKIWQKPKMPEEYECCISVWERLYCRDYTWQPGGVPRLGGEETRQHSDLPDDWPPGAMLARIESLEDLPALEDDGVPFVD